MLINIDDSDLNNDQKVSNNGNGYWMRFRRFLRNVSLANVCTILCLTFGAFIIFYLCKTYIRTILVWLENQDSVIILMVIVLLFVIVSFPVTIGYIVLVCSTGYLFGIIRGFTLTVIGANCGIAVAHLVIKFVGHHNSVRNLTEMEIAKAITRVITGPLCFKIVFCTRLTPIPFGLQNTIFALSNVSSKIYHIASLLGLLPAQIVAVYVGSTVRSMQDVLENKNIPTTTYIFIALQLVFGGSVLLWVGAKARKELLKALTESDSKFNVPDKIPSFNMV